MRQTLRVAFQASFFFAAAAGAGTGCSAGHRGDARDRPAAEYETVAGESRPDRLDAAGAAQRENARAVELMKAGDLRQAEAVLKGVLSADVTHGPAHNNLGKVYYHQGDLYRAALEFQYAATLMPGAPEPLNNLGLMREAAGRLDEAAEWYAKAVALEPENPEFFGNLARARVRQGEGGEEVRALLEKLVSLDARPGWAEWARERLSRMASEPPAAGDSAEAAGRGSGSTD